MVSKVLLSLNSELHSFENTVWMVTLTIHSNSLQICQSYTCQLLTSEKAWIYSCQHIFSKIHFSLWFAKLSPAKVSHYRVLFNKFLLNKCQGEAWTLGTEDSTGPCKNSRESCHTEHDEGFSNWWDSHALIYKIAPQIWLWVLINKFQQEVY